MGPNNPNNQNSTNRAQRQNARPNTPKQQRVVSEVITINDDDELSSPKKDRSAVERDKNSMEVDLDDEKLAELKKEEANKLYSAKQYKQALKGYDEAIRLCPNIARYYGNRAACYMMLLQHRDALKDAKKCIELDPKFIKAYGRIIKCCLTLGDILEAESTIKKFSQLEPTKQSIAGEIRDLENLKRFWGDVEKSLNTKDVRKALYFTERCLDISPYCLKYKITKAECLARLKRYSEAELVANDVLLHNKQNADAIYVRGLCFYYQDNIDNAFKYFQQVLRLAPDHNGALHIYKKAKQLKTKKDEGNAAFGQDKLQEAYNLYTEALLIDPENDKTNAKLHYNKATVAAKLKKISESISECTEALKLDETYLKALLRRASCYMEQENYEEAVRDYEKVCTMDKSKDSKRLLADAKTALKRSKRKDYYKILGIEKNASTDDIKKAYRKRAMVHHPDRHANASDLEKKDQEKKFKEVGEAYGVLSDPKKRSRYDSGVDLDESELSFNDDMHTRFQAFFDTSFGPECGRAFRFEYY